MYVVVSVEAGCANQDEKPSSQQIKSMGEDKQATGRPDRQTGGKRTAADWTADDSASRLRAKPYTKTVT